MVDGRGALEYKLESAAPDQPRRHPSPLDAEGRFLGALPRPRVFPAGPKAAQPPRPSRLPPADSLDGEELLGPARPAAAKGRAGRGLPPERVTPRPPRRLSMFGAVGRQERSGAGLAWPAGGGASGLGPAPRPAGERLSGGWSAAASGAAGGRCAPGPAARRSSRRGARW